MGMQCRFHFLLKIRHHLEAEDDTVCSRRKKKKRQIVHNDQEGRKALEFSFWLVQGIALDCEGVDALMDLAG